MKGSRRAYWRFLSKTYGPLWFLRKPSRWWSPSARTLYAGTLFAAALIEALKVLKEKHGIPDHIIH